jgi:hypothetical protein
VIARLFTRKIFPSISIRYSSCGEFCLVSEIRGVLSRCSLEIGCSISGIRLIQLWRFASEMKWISHASSVPNSLSKTRLSCLALALFLNLRWRSFKSGYRNVSRNGMLTLQVPSQDLYNVGKVERGFREALPEFVLQSSGCGQGWT